MHFSFYTNACSPLQLSSSISTTSSSLSSTLSSSSTSLQPLGQIDEVSVEEQEEDLEEIEDEGQGKRKEKEPQLQVSEPSLLSAFSPFDQLCWVVRQQEDLMDSDEEGVMWKKYQKTEKELEEEEDKKEEKEREELKKGTEPSGLSSSFSSSSSSFVSQKERITPPFTLWTPDKHQLFLKAVRLSGGPLAPVALICEKLVKLGMKDLTPARVSSFLTNHRRGLGLAHWSAELHDKFVVAIEKCGGIDGASATPLMRELKDNFLTRSQVSNHLIEYRRYLRQSTEFFEENPLEQGRREIKRKRGKKANRDEEDEREDEDEDEEEEEVEEEEVKYSSSSSSSSFSSTSTSGNQMGKTPKLKPSSWPPKLEKFFIEAVNKCGGPTLAKPKGVYQKLMEMGVQVRYRQVWKHLSKHSISLGLPAGRGYFVWSTGEYFCFNLQLSLLI
jgi:SHAQKYF class myb-like DNA-binding protein